MACGYSQVEGVDFTETYSPVVNDITLRTLLVLIITHRYRWIIMDIETAFLNGILKDDERIYMEAPKGFGYADELCVYLKKTIYGLKQSSKAFFDALAKCLKEKCGMIQSKADPCAFSHKSGNLHIGIHVDDILCVGEQDKIDGIVEELKNTFGVTTNTELNDYLSCLLYTSPSPRDKRQSRMPSSA